MGHYQTTFSFLPTLTCLLIDVQNCQKEYCKVLGSKSIKMQTKLNSKNLHSISTSLTELRDIIIYTRNDSITSHGLKTLGRYVNQSIGKSPKISLGFIR